MYLGGVKGKTLAAPALTVGADRGPALCTLIEEVGVVQRTILNLAVPYRVKYTIRVLSKG